MKESTIGRLLLEDAVPKQFHPHIGVLNGKGIRTLYAAIAENAPEQYREVSKKLNDVANRAGYESGGYSFGPEHMRADPETQAIRDRFSERVRAILADPTLSPQMRDAELVKTSVEHASPIQDSILKNALASKNPLGLQVESGAKGKAENLKALIAGDTLYSDSQYKPIPYPVTHSFSEGLRPHEYFAGTFGARLALTLTKLGTAAGGWLCISKGTSVLMADGTEKPIEAVVVGDVVVGSDMAGVTSPTRVTATFSHGVKQCRRYVFRDLGAKKHTVELTATPDHNVLARLAYGNAKTCQGKSLAKPLGLMPLKRASTVFEAQPVTGGRWGGVAEPRAAILGVMLGDGYLGRSGRGSASALQLSCADPRLIGDMLPDYKELGLQLKPASGYAWMVTRPDTRGGANPLAAWLKELGLFGKRSTEKFIPPVVWTWDDESLAEFIGGLIATDGSILPTRKGRVSGGVSFASVSHQMVSVLRRLLSIRFGVNATPPCCLPPEKREHAVNDLWVLTVGSDAAVRRFAERIPVPGVKADRNGVLRDRPVSTSKYAKRQAYRPIMSECQDAGEVETFDIEVEHPDHLFVLASGLIVSNSKRLNNMSHRLLVTAHDAPNDPEHVRGMPGEIDDPDNEGALLSQPAGGYARNTVLTRQVIADLKRQGVKEALLRSPLVGGPADGGVYGRDVGVRERGRISPIGDYVGLAASQSISEPLTQMLISSKHSGGVAGSTKGQQGFPVIDRMFSIPSEYAGGAVHAQADGLVTAIEPAPQGGHYITAGGEKHYALPDQEITVKAGDKVEAGDTLTDGIPNPAEFVPAKGIGEGRRMFMKAFMDTARASSFNPNRRNVELVARGYVDSVRFDREVGDHVPGDVASYTWLENNYTPREGAADMHPKEALGKYLEKPVLHYSIGTKVRPSMLPEFEKWGVQKIHAHAEPPPFSPIMVRSQDIPANDPDFMARMLGSNLEKSLLRGVHRGSIADASGTSYATALSQGIGFGEQGKTKGWDPSAPPLG